MPSTYQPTGATTLRRLPERGTYDRATVHAILLAKSAFHHSRDGLQFAEGAKQ